MAGPARTRLWVVSRHCVACDHCVLACRRRHGVARIRRAGHALAVALPEVCQHCEFPVCVEHCIAGGLCQDPETGRVTLDGERCVACWSCLLACPHGAVHRDERERPVSVRCDRCAGYRSLACVMGCPTGALRCGTEAALAADLARPGSVLAPLAAALAFVLFPAIGLTLSLLGVPGVVEGIHDLGIAAGGLTATALLLPFVGRPLWSRVRRAVWTRWHMLVGALAACVALVHAAGRFGINAQALAAASLGGLVLTGVGYRYLRPLVRMWTATFRREADAHPAPAEEGAASPAPHPRIAAAHAASRAAAAWVAWLERLDALLAACRTAHILWAILTVGLVVAHVIIMTVVGAGTP